MSEMRSLSWGSITPRACALDFDCLRSASQRGAAAALSWAWAWALAQAHFCPALLGGRGERAAVKLWFGLACLRLRRACGLMAVPVLQLPVEDDIDLSDVELDDLEKDEL